MGGMVCHIHRKPFAKGFLSDMGSMVCHLRRKPFAKSFLSGMVGQRVISIGNYYRKVSCPSWQYGVLPPQEPFFSYKIISSKKISKNA